MTTPVEFGKINNTRVGVVAGTTLVEKSQSCDGWNVRIETAGRSYVLHFLHDPTDQEIAETTTEFEQKLFSEIVEKHIDENEESLI